MAILIVYPYISVLCVVDLRKMLQILNSDFALNVMETMNIVQNIYIHTSIFSS